MVERDGCYKYFKNLFHIVFYFGSLIYIINSFVIENDYFKNVEQCKNSFLLEYIMTYTSLIIIRTVIVCFDNCSKIRIVAEKMCKYNTILTLMIIIESIFICWGYSQYNSGYCKENYPKEVWEYGYLTYILQICTNIIHILILIGINIKIFCISRNYRNVPLLLG